MIKLNIEELLKVRGKSKYWLCCKMNVTTRNINRIIRGQTSAISFKYLEQFCYYLNCTPNDLITIETLENEFETA